MTLIYFIVILGVIVFIHELGHLLVAKAFGVYCREFAIGFGPVLKRIQGKETLYSIRALPLGGFVSMAGETDVDSDDIEFSRTLKGIHPFKRILIMLAGIFSNVVLAFVIFVIIFGISGKVNVPPEAVVAGVVENSASEAAGVLANDRIVAITFEDGRIMEPKDFYEVLNVTQMVSQPMVFTMEREGTNVDLTITPVFSEEENRYLLGMYLPQAQVKDIAWYESFVYAGNTIVESISSLIMALGFLFRGVGLQTLSGPVGIYEVTAQQAEAGFSSLVVLTAILSLNVGLFNLLPLPILDGGRVVITLVEWIIGKPLNQKLENALISISMILLLGLVLLVTWQDLGKLFG
jgi:regulator of sigma E protease